MKLSSLKQIYFTITALVIIAHTELAFASLDSFMKFASKGNALVSVNAGGIIEDQNSGYFTGGSIIRRGPRPMELVPLTVQTPSFAFDPCTGSGDLRWGGFSYIKGREFSEYFKALAASSGTYVAKMAIKSACPQCEDIMSYLEAVARDINGMTFGQCEQSKAIAEGLMGRIGAANSQKCMAKSALLRGGSDLYETTKQCGENPDRFGEAGDESEFKSMLPDNYNLVWKALSNGSGSGGSNMKELLMSISGSVIGKKEAGRPSISSLASLVEKEDMLEKYIGKPGIGTQRLKIYKCDEGVKCLNPSMIEQEISSSGDSLFGKVQKNMESIIEKVIKNEGVLNDEEQALIEYTQIPLISLLEIELSSKDAKSALQLSKNNEFIEVVCYDMVTHFMQKMLAQARDAVEELAIAQIDNTAIDRFQRNTERVQKLLAAKNLNAMRNLQTILSVKERLYQQEKVFQMGFIRFKDI